MKKQPTIKINKNTKLNIDKESLSQEIKEEAR